MPVIRPPLTVAQILAWADAYRRRTGSWPSAVSGSVPEAPGEKWRNIEQALYVGLRGLPGGDSLAKLLDRRRRRRQHKGPAPHSGRPWTSDEDELVRALPPAEAARRTGRTPAAVYQRRHTLGLRPARHRP
jgi:hypothetical protein